MFSGETTKTNVIALYIVFGFKGPVLKHKIYRTQDKHVNHYQGRIQDFKLGGGALKKIAPSRGKLENFWGILCEKSRFYAKKSYCF